MSAGEAWRQAIAKAEILLSEGEAEEDVSGIADAVSAFNTALRLAPRSDAPLIGPKRSPACRPGCGRSGRGSTTR